MCNKNDRMIHHCGFSSSQTNKIRELEQLNLIQQVAIWALCLLHHWHLNVLVFQQVCSCGNAKELLCTITARGLAVLVTTEIAACHTSHIIQLTQTKNFSRWDIEMMVFWAAASVFYTIQMSLLWYYLMSILPLPSLFQRVHLSQAPCNIL
jgi:hypothetical protein